MLCFHQNNALETKINFSRQLCGMYSKNDQHESFHEVYFMMELQNCNQKTFLCPQQK